MPLEHSISRWLLGGCLLGLAGLMVSCASMDRSTYHSSVNLPTTVTVEDPYTHHVYWGIDIPVGRDLTIDMDRGGEVELFSVSGRPAKSMTWKLTGPGRDESGNLKLPGTPVVVVVSYRPSPEYPPGYKGPRASEAPPQEPAPQLAPARQAPVASPPPPAMPAEPPMPPQPQAAPTPVPQAPPAQPQSAAPGAEGELRDLEGALEATPTDPAATPAVEPPAEEQPIK